MMSIGWVIARWRRGAAALAARQQAARGAARASWSAPSGCTQVMRDGPSARARGHGLELRLGPARHLLRRARRHRAVDTLAAARGARRDQDRAPARARRRSRSSFPRCALDINGSHEYCGDGSMRQAGADLAGGAPRRRADPRRRRRPPARAAGRARAQHRVSEPGADRRPCPLEHLPRCARRRRRAADAGSTRRWRCCRRAARAETHA